MKNFEIYGYSVESFNKLIGPMTGIDLGGFWDKYNHKVYDTEEIAKKAIEENPYKSGCKYKIVPLYRKIN